MDTHVQPQIVGEVPTGLDLEPLHRALEIVRSRQQALGLPAGIINVTFMDDGTMRNMNRDYSGHDYATDVLTFDYLESGGPIDGVVGEIAIGFETARVQAEVAGISWSHEVALLTVHGLLHMAGHDHADSISQSQVQRLQSEILSAADVEYREFTWQD